MAQVTGCQHPHGRPGLNHWLLDSSAAGFWGMIQHTEMQSLPLKLQTHINKYISMHTNTEITQKYIHKISK